MSLIALQMPPKFTVVPVTIQLNLGNGQPSVESYREVPGTLILFGFWVGISCEIGCGHVLHPQIPQRGFETGGGLWLPADAKVITLQRIVIHDRDDDGIDFEITTNDAEQTRLAWGSFTRPRANLDAHIAEEAPQAAAG